MQGCQPHQEAARKEEGEPKVQSQLYPEIMIFWQQLKGNVFF
jgi:hypothetical protein